MIKIKTELKKVFYKLLMKIYPESLISPQKDGYKPSSKIAKQEIRQRELELYGAERVNRARLYESWAVKDSWRLMSEALPLLSGFDPDDQFLMKTDENYGNNMNELRKHAKQCVEKGLLPVTDRDNEPEDWLIHPFDAYRWARVSRIEVPEMLATLMEFVMAAVKQPVAQGNFISKSHDTRDSDEDRERVLGSALAILAAHPERCKNDQGYVSVDKIMEFINEKGKFLFGNHPPNLSDNVMRDLINKWLNTLP